MVRNGQTAQRERERLKDEGFESQEVVKLQPKRNWYREDGTLVGMLPVDPYHQERFRAKGWSLSASPHPAERERHYLGFPGGGPLADETVAVRILEDKE